MKTTVEDINGIVLFVEDYPCSIEVGETVKFGKLEYRIVAKYPDDGGVRVVVRKQ